MDELRARAYLDLLLGKDSRPRRETTADGGGGSAGRDGGSPGGGDGAGPDSPAAPARRVDRLPRDPVPGRCPPGSPGGSP